MTPPAAKSKLPLVGPWVALTLLTIAIVKWPLVVLGVYFSDFGGVATSLLLTVWITLALSTISKLSNRFSSFMRAKLPLVTVSVFATALLFTTPVHASLRSITASPTLGGQASGAESVFIVFNDDFGNNSQPRPDAILLVTPAGGEVHVTPILRDWAYSLDDPNITLASKYFGIDACEPYCELKDLGARISMEHNADGLGNRSAAGFAVEVAANELGIESYGVVEISPLLVTSALEALAPLTLEVKRPIPMGGKWVNEQMVDIRGWIEPGVQDLSPEEAYWFARARWTSSNESRVERQLQLVKAILDQKSTLEIMQALKHLEYVTTSLSGNQIASLLIALGWSGNPQLYISKAVGEN